MAENIKAKCKECSKEFEITPGEQEFYKGKGWELPKRCADCRKKLRGKKKKKEAPANEE